jgi:hypothetical protein
MEKTIKSVIDVSKGVPQEVKDRICFVLKDREIDFSDIPPLQNEQKPLLKKKQNKKSAKKNICLRLMANAKMPCIVFTTPI